MKRLYVIAFALLFVGWAAIVFAEPPAPAQVPPGPGWMHQGPGGPGAPIILPPCITGSRSS